MPPSALAAAVAVAALTVPAAGVTAFAVDPSPTPRCGLLECLLDPLLGGKKTPDPPSPAPTTPGAPSPTTGGQTPNRPAPSAGATGEPAGPSASPGGATGRRGNPGQGDDGDATVTVSGWPDGVAGMGSADDRTNRRAGWVVVGLVAGAAGVAGAGVVGWQVVRRVRSRPRLDNLGQPID